MPYRCTVYGCRGNYDRNGQKVSVFKFPNDPDLLKKWTSRLMRGYFVPTKHSRVCELHFDEDDIIREASFFDEKTGRLLTSRLQRNRLKEGAVPLHRVTTHFETVKKGKLSKDPSNPDYVPSILNAIRNKRKASTKTLKTAANGEATSEKDDKAQVWPSLLNLHPISSEASTSGVSTAPKLQQSTTNPTAVKPETLSPNADDSDASKPNASGETKKEDPDKLYIVKMEIEDDGYADNEEESFLASLTSSSSQRSQDSTQADYPDCYSSSTRTETNQEIAPTLPKIVPTPPKIVPEMNESPELLLNGVEHPVEVFFRDIAQTVMQFPPHLIAETKTKVSSLVYDMVVRSISEGFTNMKQQAL